MRNLRAKHNFPHATHSHTAQQIALNGRHVKRRIANGATLLTAQCSIDSGSKHETLGPHNARCELRVLNTRSGLLTVDFLIQFADG